MPPLRDLLFSCTMVWAGTAWAQQDAPDSAAVPVVQDTLIARSSAPESLDADTVPLLDWRMRHRPARATIYSAILPGAGQIYNRKYWKAPIVWAGLGTCVFFIQDNNRQYQRYKQAYLTQIDGDPATVDEFDGRYSDAQLRNVADTYQRWRDLSVVALSLVYILNIIDATVDGYFVRFDVGRNLGMDLRPSLPMAAQGATGLTLSLRL